MWGFYRFLKSQLNLPGRYNLLHRSQCLECFLINGCINFYHRHCFAATLATTEMKATDVHPTLAENGANSSDHSRHIPVTHHQHVTLRYRLDMKSVYFGDTPFARLLAKTKDSARQGLLDFIT